MAPPQTQLEKRGPASSSGQMAAGVAALWTRLRVRWASMARQQRRWSMVAVALLTTLLGGLLWYGLRIDWRTLYAGLDPDDARQIGLTLTQAQIPFRCIGRNEACGFLRRNWTRPGWLTAAKGGAKSGRMGFEIFDKPNWVGSEFDEQVNYQRALEGELEHTVGTLSDVEVGARASGDAHTTRCFANRSGPPKPPWC